MKAVINQFYWIAVFSFIFTYLTGTAVYAVVVSSTNAEVTDTMLIKASETTYAIN
jgi:hypothetical protein